MSKTFITPNLNFVAAMVAYNARVVDTDKDDPRRVFFTLEQPPVLVFEQGQDGYPRPVHSGTFETLFVMFNSRSLVLPPGSFDSLRNMKSIVYS